MGGFAFLNNNKNNLQHCKLTAVLVRNVIVQLWKAIAELFKTLCLIKQDWKQHVSKRMFGNVLFLRKLVTGSQVWRRHRQL